MATAKLVAAQVGITLICATLASQRLRPPGKLIDLQGDGIPGRRWPSWRRRRLRWPCHRCHAPRRSTDWHS